MWCLTWRDTMNNRRSTRQHSLWKLASCRLKTVLCNPWVFRWCLLAFRMSEEIKHWFSSWR